MKELKSIIYSMTYVILIIFLLSSYAKDNNDRVIIIATTPAAAGTSAGPFFHSEDTKLLADRAGYRAELLLQAGEQCHANIKFLLVPWKRALHLVEHGGADAAFSSSYKTERAIYGAYPMKNGKPDSYRAVRDYSYFLFTDKESDLKWNGKEITGSRKKIAVERSSAGVDIVKSLGLEPIEINNEDKMILMLIAKRVDGIVGIEDNVKLAIARAPQLASQIEIQQPPLKSKHGYVMFSKRFYYQHTQLVDCFWDAVGKIRASAEYKELIASYSDKKSSD